MSITIRGARADDLDAVLALEATSARNPWTREQREQELALPYAVFLVAETGGDLAGLLDLHIVFEDAHINDVITDVRFRRQGIATALLSEALARAEQAGCTAVTLEVRAHNPAAIALYQNAGFTEIARKTDYYRNPPDDAISMISVFENTKEETGKQ